MNPTVVTIGLGRNILKKGSRERMRMSMYAQHLGTLHVIVLTRKEHKYSEVQRDGNLFVYPTNSRTRFGMLIDAFSIARTILKHTQDIGAVISAQDPLEIGWLCFIISKMTNACLHIQVHGDYFSSSLWIGNSPARRLRRRAGLFLLARTPSIRVVSLRIKNSLTAQHIRAERITVLPIRPELETFLGRVREPRHAHAPSFLFIGRLSPEKNIPRIIRAFALVRRTHAEAVLRIAGDGPEKQKIELLIHELHLENAVILKSWTEDVAEEMQNADIFLLASLHEAYGLTLIEAMASCMPLVTTDVGCVGEIVEDGVHGIVVKEASTGAYALAMERMLSDHIFRKTCAENGHKTALRLGGNTADAYARAWVTGVLSGCYRV